MNRKTADKLFLFFIFSLFSPFLPLFFSFSLFFLPSRFVRWAKNLELRTIRCKFVFTIMSCFDYSLKRTSNNNRQAFKQVVFIETGNRSFQKRLENSFQSRAYLFHTLSIFQEILILVNYSNIVVIKLENNID